MPIFAKTKVMKQNFFLRYIPLIMIVLIIAGTSEPAFAQATKKKNDSPKSSGGDYNSSRATRKKNARRGGRITLPVGIEGKKINIGIGSGLAIPSLSMKSEEHATMGINSQLYAHYLFGGRTTMGIGLNTNIIYLGSSNSSFYNQNPSITHAASSPWMMYTISPSFLTNYTIKQRISAQFLINGGLLNVTIPPNQLSFTDSIYKIGDPVVVEKRDYTYKTMVEKGWFVSGALQFNYALTHNIEARVGLDYFYGRFSYSRIETSAPLMPEERYTREMKLIDLFAGFAFSF
jgi:hypothetical protein